MQTHPLQQFANTLQPIVRESSQASGYHNFFHGFTHLSRGVHNLYAMKHKPIYLHEYHNHHIFPC